MEDWMSAELHVMQTARSADADPNYTLPLISLQTTPI